MAKTVARDWIERAEKYFEMAEKARGNGNERVLVFAATGDLAARIATYHLLTEREPQVGSDKLDALLAEGHGSAGYKAPTASEDVGWDDDEGDGEDPWLCGYCRAKFYFEDELTDHVRRAHDNGGAPKREAKLAVGDLAFILFDKGRNVEVHRYTIPRDYLQRPQHLKRLQTIGRADVQGWADRNGYKIVETHPLSPLRTV